MTIKLHWTLVLITSFAANSAIAQTFLTLNAQWFWDYKEPHEGGIIATFDDFPPSRDRVQAKAQSIAEIVLQNKVDLIALQEIENRDVLQIVLHYLPPGWAVVFQQGRDTYTGQDVGILTRLDLIPNTVSSYPQIVGYYDGVSVTPSKLLGVGVQYNGDSYLVITSHFISKRNNNAARDKKRAAQANAISSIARQELDQFDHIVVLGDFNDTSDSITLRELQGLDHPQQGLYSTVDEARREVYSLPKYETLVDHILVGSSLVETCNKSSIIPTQFISDHNGVVLSCLE